MNRGPHEGSQSQTEPPVFTLLSEPVKFGHLAVFTHGDEDNSRLVLSAQHTAVETSRSSIQNIIQLLLSRNFPLSAETAGFNEIVLLDFQIHLSVVSLE